MCKTLTKENLGRKPLKSGGVGVATTKCCMEVECKYLDVDWSWKQVMEAGACPAAPEGRVLGIKKGG